MLFFIVFFFNFTYCATGFTATPAAVAERVCEAEPTAAVGVHMRCRQVLFNHSPCKVDEGVVMLLRWTGTLRVEKYNQIRPN